MFTITVKEKVVEYLSTGKKYLRSMVFFDSGRIMKSELVIAYLRRVNIMKNVVILFLSVLMALIVSACVSANTEKDDVQETERRTVQEEQLCSEISIEVSSDSSSGFEETGYEDGYIQREYLFYNGELYVYSDVFLEKLPEKYNLVGQISGNSNFEMPKSELCSSNLSVGLNVYTSDDETDVYVEVLEKRFEKFKKTMD